jgi:hypothetical protein
MGTTSRFPFLQPKSCEPHHCIAEILRCPIGLGSSLPLIFCIHVHSGPIYWGVIYLAKKIIRWWYFTCKNPENIICDGILHVNMFHYFKIPYCTFTFFTKFTYNEYIGPYFLSHVVLRFLPVNSPSQLVETLYFQDVEANLALRQPPQIVIKICDNLILITT